VHGREREREREMNTTKQIISVWWDQCPHHVIKIFSSGAAHSL
jgi:hypothetical protein